MRNGMQDAYVNAGSVVLFDDGVGHSFKEDVLDAQLYIQLAASKKYSKFAEFEAWRTTYFAAMATFGWIVSGRKYDSHPIEKDELFEPWSWIERELDDRVPASLIAHAKRVLVPGPERVLNPPAQLLLGENTLQSEPWQAEVNERLSGDISAHVLQIPPATQLFSVVLQLSFVHAAPSMSSVLISFKTVEPIEPQSFLLTFDPDRIVGNIAVASYSAELLDIRYAQFREPFITALGGRRTSMILRLEDTEQ
ncbi:hypothetical protein QN400_17200 [Pseudomonas sp. RTC3]|uniref:hypothetical protein n=1 Tax=unclassified Pseudomonas TaxID=196821 RepID=UPI002AB52B07|nr:MULTISPECIES: hypothetical protein [unclassified Pseudomonas]MEB0063766.1 hypothetical protein [Pseudomonas sp. RTC3]MDY7567847.1 hypothetical protein [Pseudomonas sp. 5C2]MEB0007084.1 hypothetical protein [Pseudomonas sp. RTB2]MEB0019696.1 hypothetical protein [Pseudomonas sp. RTB3]MEB0027868.1 hypothetical protein [Pseudomonas sp. MH9.2]